MLPTTVILDRINKLLADDATTLANLMAMKLKLVKAPFVPSPTLDPSTLTIADFGGYADLSPTAGNQNSFIDPVTGLRVVELVEPAGGWHWQTTSAANLPQTIYGWVLTDSTGAIAYASGLLPAPIPLTLSGQGFDVTGLRFNFLSNSPQ